MTEAGEVLALLAEASECASSRPAWNRKVETVGGGGGSVRKPG